MSAPQPILTEPGGDCLHLSKAWDIDHDWYWLQCDRPRGHDGQHHPNTYAGPLDEDDFG